MTGTAPDDSAGSVAGASGASLTVALAEFAALRAEIVSTRTTQSAFVGVGLTAVGALFALGTAEGADRRLLLAVPPLTLVISLLHLAESYRIHRLGTYIRDTLWPYVQCRTRETTDPPPSWEQQHQQDGSDTQALFPGVVFDGAPFGLFSAAGLVALQVQPPATRLSRVS